MIVSERYKENFLGYKIVLHKYYIYKSSKIKIRFSENVFKKT